MMKSLKQMANSIIKPRIKLNHTTNAVTEFVDDDAPGTLTLS